MESPGLLRQAPLRLMVTCQPSKLDLSVQIRGGALLKGGTMNVTIIDPETGEIRKGPCDWHKRNPLPSWLEAKLDEHWNALTTEEQEAELEGVRKVIQAALDKDKSL